MTTALQRRRGTDSSHQTFTGLNAELTVNTTNGSIHVHDGTTAGGFETLRADLNNLTSITTSVSFADTGTLTFGDSDNDIVISTDGTYGKIESYNNLKFFRNGSQKFQITSYGAAAIGTIYADNFTCGDQGATTYGNTSTNALKVGTFRWSGTSDADGSIATTATNADLDIGGKEILLNAGSTVGADGARALKAKVSSSYFYNYTGHWQSLSGTTNSAMHTIFNNNTTSTPWFLRFMANHSQYYSPAVGYIGQEGAGSTGTPKLFVSGMSRGLLFDSTAIYPVTSTGGNAHDSVDLGKSSVAFDDIYATNTVIQTSDRNAKQDIEELTEAESRVAARCKQLIRKYRYISSVESKGDDARIHIGIIAQDLQQAFTDEGLDASRYGMFCSNTFWEAEIVVPAHEETYAGEDGEQRTQTIEESNKVKTYDNVDDAPEGAVEVTRLAVRYNELLAFIIAAM
jgi:hypothetical protein